MASRSTLRASSSGFTVVLPIDFERQPRLVEGGFQDDQRLWVERAVVEPAHGSILTADKQAY